MLKIEWLDFVGKVLRKFNTDKTFPGEFDYLKSQITTMQELNNFISSLTKQSKFCPNCYSDLPYIIRMRKFGCRECYGVFGEEIVTKIFKISKHVGKKPKTNILAEKLIAQMNEAAAAERYEEATEIRNKIRELKTKV